MEAKHNEFISYLNSLHNVSANGANALAESQALSPYFPEIYEPFPIVDQLAEMLSDDGNRVIILTGHAGDGKSTVAVDVLKRLRQIPPDSPLSSPLNEREDIPSAGVTVVKDMSELSSERRGQWLKQAFTEQGSWLVVSNTGPLLHSLIDYADAVGGVEEGIESRILETLDQPLDGHPSVEHILSDFGKELVIVNLTRLDNAVLGSKLLNKLVSHSAWNSCTDCPSQSACPLKLNRDALFDAKAVTEQRVRWIYKRINAYEQRLTLRQIVAQLAFGITAGMTCDEAQQQVEVSSSVGQDRGSDGLEQILFSESFFGYRGGKPSPDAEGLFAVSLARRENFGAPAGVEFDRSLSTDPGMGWAKTPFSLDSLKGRWRSRAEDASGVRWRFALRRMAFMFGEISPGQEARAESFLDAFIQSPSLRLFDDWQASEKLTLSKVQVKRLRESCLQVLLEVFSGFSAGQFQKQDSLYLTLRRPDQAVVQPTQLVIETLPFRDFDISFDPVERAPVLSWLNGRARLILTLPLLDYIRRRSEGELGSVLSPIHQAQLDWFQAELLQVTADRRRSDDEIELLRAGISGEVHLHRFLLDQEQGVLERN